MLTLKLHPFRALAARAVAGALIALAVAIALAVPSTAGAAQGGVDVGSHAWVKVSNEEIASGSAGAICAYFIPGSVVVSKWVCAPFSALAHTVVNGNQQGGIWLEYYPQGTNSRGLPTVRMGTY